DMAGGWLQGCPAPDAVGGAEEDDASSDRGVRRNALSQLHDVHCLRLCLGWRERPRASELTPRHLHAAAREQCAAAVDHRPRNVPSLEREATASRRHVALSL